MLYHWLANRMREATSDRLVPADQWLRFDLPRTAARRTGRRSELSQIDVLLYLVESRPGRSALELSQAIYGDEASELRVRQDLGRLVSSGEIECRTNGSLNHPPSYFPIPLRRQE
jgi:hypothetical protein